MDFSKYWVYGDCTLHSGDKSDRLWDAKLLRKPENDKDLEEIVNFLRKYIDVDLKVIGIRTMGAEIGMMVGNCIPFDPRRNMLEDNLYDDEYVIFDDVMTRGSSVLQVIDVVRRLPKYVIVLVIRSDITGGATEIEGIPIYEVRSLMRKGAGDQDMGDHAL